MRIAYFDCFNGAAGDMIVASLIDAGADVVTLRQQLAALPLEGYSLSIERVTKQGFAATRFHVHLDDTTEQPHRHLGHIRKIIDASRLPPAVKEMTLRIFTRLAEAEAKVHGTTIERVHFHEVGAVDAILDVVGAVLGLDLLRADQVVCSAVPVGSGTVTCRHGVMPVPAPATAELLRGIPMAASDETGELTTPTGAAVLTTLAASFGPAPTMTLQAVGYGAGTREGRTRPNLLRVLIGEANTLGETDTVTVLETNLDDCPPELIGHCLELLFAEGALDAFITPIQMKKSRPGVMLTVLCEPHRADALERVLFAETTTFGVRRHLTGRTRMRRRHETVTTRFGDIRVKVGEWGEQRTASPEYEDCRAAAERCGVPLRDVFAAAGAAWASRPA